MEIAPVGDMNQPAPVQATQTGPISEQVNTLGQANAPAAPLPDVMLGANPVISPDQGNNAAATAQGVNPALATTIAQAISLGMVQAPTTAAGWAQLEDQFSNPGERNAVQQAEAKGGATTPSPGQAQLAATGGTPTGGMGSFLSAIRQHESNGNYQANSGDGAYGAYQFIPSTWNSEATAAGFGQYANGRADLAPPQVQDAVAQHMASGYAQQFGNNYDMMARAWFDPAYVNDPNYAPPGNNGLTIGAYGQDITKLMGQSGGSVQPPPSTPAPGGGANVTNVVRLAQSQLGVPYMWGGESAGKNFDCSGLVQWVYGQAGDNLPRTAQEQYNATPKVQGTSNLQPGDLLFFGSGANGIEHVGIYIGNGQMIDAPHTGADVRVDQVFGQGGQPLWGNFVGATRPADPTGSTTAAMGSVVQQKTQQSQQQYGSILQEVLSQMGSLAQNNRTKYLTATRQLGASSA